MLVRDTLHELGMNDIKLERATLGIENTRKLPLFYVVIENT